MRDGERLMLLPIGIFIVALLHGPLLSVISANGNSLRSSKVPRPKAVWL